MMKAIAIDGYSRPPSLRSLPVRGPKENEILLRIHAAGVNVYDWKERDGALKGIISQEFPLVLGFDV
jgi:NADPH:quinone reductase-like Zn-dependent oxidoreductase